MKKLFFITLFIGVTSTSCFIQNIYSQNSVIGDFDISDGGSDKDLRLKFNSKTAFSSFNTRSSENDVLYINWDWKTGIGYRSDFNKVSIFGNVGIGTTNPTEKIHISESFDGEVSLLVQNTHGIGTRTFLSTLPDRSTLQTDRDFGIWTNGTGWAERFTVKNDGKVGIGTTTPTAKLTVAGDILAREIRVEANAGADFVFEENYLLKPLKEVEQFIAENKHLPDIAPADTMIQNGVNMGEFQIQLLQKIEELTLYMIEQGKQNEKLQQQLSLQELMVDELRSELKDLKKDK